MKSISKGFKWSRGTIIWPAYNQATDVRKLRKKLGICVSCFVNRVPAPASDLQHWAICFFPHFQLNNSSFQSYQSAGNHIQPSLVGLRCHSHFVSVPLGKFFAVMHNTFLLSLLWKKVKLQLSFQEIISFPQFVWLLL